MRQQCAGRRKQQQRQRHAQQRAASACSSSDGRPSSSPSIVRLRLKASTGAQNLQCFKFRVLSTTLRNVRVILTGRAAHATARAGGRLRLIVRNLAMADGPVADKPLNRKQIRGADFRCKIHAQREAHKAANKSGDLATACPAQHHGALPDHDCLVHLEQLARGAVASRHSASRCTPPPPLLPDALHDALEDYNSPPPPPPPHPPHIAPDAQRLARVTRHRLLALKQLQVDQLLSRDEASQVAVNIATALLTQPTHAQW